MNYVKLNNNKDVQNQCGRGLKWTYTIKPILNNVKLLHICCTPSNNITILLRSCNVIRNRCYYSDWSGIWWEGGEVGLTNWHQTAEWMVQYEFYWQNCKHPDWTGGYQGHINSGCTTHRGIYHEWVRGNTLGIFAGATEAEVKIFIIEPLTKSCELYPILTWLLNWCITELAPIIQFCSWYFS